VWQAFVTKCACVNKSAATPRNCGVRSSYAFTAAWEKGIDPRKAAIAIGCNPDTVMRHYVKLDEQAVTDEVMSKLADTLAAPRKPTDGGTSRAS
jgi:hypothetical protein